MVATALRWLSYALLATGFVIFAVIAGWFASLPLGNLGFGIVTYGLLLFGAYRAYKFLRHPEP